MENSMLNVRNFKRLNQQMLTNIIVFSERLCDNMKLI